MALDLKQPPNFGNYMLKDFSTIKLPQTVEFYPETYGAYLLCVAVVVLIIFALCRIYLRWKRNFYRRSALKQLKSLKNITTEKITASIPSILRKVSLHAYPKTTSMSHKLWLQYLNVHAPKNCTFDDELTKQLYNIDYLPISSWGDETVINNKLYKKTYRWIKKHKALK